MSSDKNPSNNSKDSFDGLIEKLDRTDFDGHTDFANLSYEQRLTWLSQAVVFRYRYAKTRESINTENPSREK